MKEYSWFIAYTYPKAEKKVYSSLLRSGVNAFLPLTTQKRVWSDRVKLVEVPLFSSYVFVESSEQKLPVLSEINGISKFVRFNKEYAIIKREEIRAIKTFVEKGKNVEVYQDGLQEGQEVKVKQGPFIGLQGVLVRKGRKSRFIIEVEGLDRFISVDIPSKHLVPL